MEALKDAEAIISNFRTERTFTYALASYYSNYTSSTVISLEIVEYSSRKCITVRDTTLRNIRILCQASGGVQYSLDYSAICEFRFGKQQTPFLLLQVPHKHISKSDVQMKYSCLNLSYSWCR